MKKVSIITPCFNDGKYLPEAVESTRKIVESGFCEHIIVDDGSDDPETLAIYKKLESSHAKIIFAGKVGLGKARNIGIADSKCAYYLNLDADNRIHQDYPRKCAAILDKNADVGVVYSNFRFFGKASHSQAVAGFDADQLLKNNYIDTCTVIRKKVWEDCGGYDESEMLWEDWNFWHSVLAMGWQFYHIDEILFDYRERFEGSLKMTAIERGNEVEAYIAGKYGLLYRKKFIELLEKYQDLMRNPDIVSEENVRLKNVIECIEKSISWRITRPFRKIMSNLK